MSNLGNAISLVFSSLLNRRTTALLTVASIAVSAALLSAVDRVRTDAQASFENTISGTDLIIGARSGELNLLLYSVFRIGSPTNNLSWPSHQQIASRDEVAWTIPISLGDAHRGYRVLGTNDSYFDHYQYADRQPLELTAGSWFTSATEAVIGAEVAEQLNYAVGREIVVSHGVAETSFIAHDDNPFVVSGILAPTGTPVDRTVHISLQGMDLIHDKGEHSEDGSLAPDYAPDAVTAILVGLESKIAIFTLQRFVNEYEEEPLSAIIPGVALQQLWGLIGVAEYALFGISAMVVLAGVLGLLTTLMVSLNERRREMSVLRSVGATPGHVFGLLVTEAGLLALAGAVSGILLVQLGVLISGKWVQSAVGIRLDTGFRVFEAYILVGIVMLAVLISTIPAWRAYRNSLADGLTVKL